jgi:hypothetical protein
VVDNGSSPRGYTAARRVVQAEPKGIVVHTPGQASGLNHVEIYFALVHRKVLTPNDVASLEDVAPRLRLDEERSNQPPRPLPWKFTRATLAEFLPRLDAHGAIVDQCPVVPELPHTNHGKPVAA